MRKSVRLLSAVLVTAWVLSACSGGDTKPTPASTGAASPTAAATATETAVPTATAVPEVINGVTVTPMTAGDPVDIPEDAVLYVEGGCNYCDLPAVSLDRVYRDAAGTLHSDRLFERQLPVEDRNGPTIIEKNYIRSMAVADGGYTITISVCTRGYCGGVGNLTDDAQTTLYNSIDGGVTWTDLGTIGGGVFLVEAQKGGGIGQRIWKDAGGAWQFAYQYLPRGESLPSNIDGKDAWVTSIGNHHPVVRGENKISLYWLAGASVPDLDPQLPAGSEVWSARLSPSGYATDYHYLVEWASAEGPRYVGLMKERTGAPSIILGRTDLQLQRGGEWMTANLVVGNTTLRAAALSRYGTFEGFPAGVPMVLDLATGQAHPIDPLIPRYANGDRTRILAAVPGPWLEVTGAGDCLNVRSAPSATAQPLGCFKDGVLLRDRGENRSAEGITWISVWGPNGGEAWASAQYLDTTGRDMAVPPLSHPKGTRTGNPAIDPVLAAIESGDPAKQLAAVRFRPTRCVEKAEGLGGPPECLPGESPDIPIEMVPVTCAEGSYMRRANFDFASLLAPAAPLYAIIRGGTTHDFAWPGGSYSLVYRSLAMPGMSILVGVDGGQIVGFMTCQPRPQDVLKNVPAADIILPPPK